MLYSCYDHGPWNPLNSAACPECFRDTTGELTQARAQRDALEAALRDVVDAARCSDAPARDPKDGYRTDALGGPLSRARSLLANLSK